MNKFLFLLLVIALYAPAMASAHVLKIDGNIGVLMHVDPNDDPIEGETATFLFKIKDKTNSFDPEHCTCGVQIIDRGKVISDQPFTPSSNLGAASTFVFPHAGIYQVVVVGRPHFADLFQPFSITFDQRVEKASESGGNTVSTILLGAAILVCVLGCGFIVGRIISKKSVI